MSALGEAAPDRRFQHHPAWTENFLFDYIKQSYLFSAEAILSAVNRVDGLNLKTAHKVDFYTRQFVDAMAPSNFLATNPEVLQTTIETGGENLLRGLTNLLDDLERGRGQLAVNLLLRCTWCQRGFRRRGFVPLRVGVALSRAMPAIAARLL